MANTVVTGVGVSYATGQITALTNNWNTSWYMSAGIATSSCSSGQSYQPSGTKGTVTAPSSGTNKYTPTFSLTGLNSGATITLYGWVRAANGLYYPSGSTTIDTYPGAPTSLSLAIQTSTSLGMSWVNNGGRTSVEVSIGGTWTTLSSVATAYTWFGLSPNSPYTLRVRSVYNGLTGAYSTLYASTLPADVPPGTPTGLTLASRVENGLYLIWSLGSGSTLSIQISFTNLSTYQEEIVSIGAVTSYTKTGLSDGTFYSVKIRASNLAGSSAYSSPITMQTSPDSPDISLVSSTSDSVTVAHNVIGNYNTVTMRIYTTGWTLLETKTISTSSTTFSGLSSNTSYIVTAYSTYNSINSITTDQYTVTTSNRPSNWYWSPAIVQGGSIDVYYSSGYKGKIVTATQWNSFTSRINQFRAYKGLSNYSFTTVSTGQSLSAALTQEIYYAIIGMYPSISPPAILSGQSVTAAVMNQMQNSLNSIT